MSDDELLANVLRRLLVDGFYFIHRDSVTVDAQTNVDLSEVAALLRVVNGWIEKHHVVGQADPEFYIERKETH